jgi:hypothetical protein
MPCALFLEYHNYKRRIRVGTKMDNTCDLQFLNNFLHFIFLGKGLMIRVNIGRKNVRDKGNGMIMGATGRGKSLGIFKNILVFGEERLEVEMKSR